MQSGWDWQLDDSKSTAPNAQMVSLLTFMAANNNISALTPEMLPMLCQSFGLPTPASTSASSASAALSSSLTSVSGTTDLATQIQTAITAAFSARDTGNSTKSLPSPYSNKNWLLRFLRFICF
jgi:hypothetical protein